MRTARRKWRSAAGATFAFALGIFLVCSMFAMAILSTSNTLIVNALGQSASEQEFLSVSCAAKLLTEAVENSRVYEVKSYDSSGGVDRTSYKTYQEKTGESSEYDIVEAALAAKVRQYWSATVLKIKAPNMNDVEVSVQFERQGTRVLADFKATLTTGDQKVVLRFVGREEPNVESTYTAADVLESTATELRWSLDSVTKG